MATRHQKTVEVQKGKDAEVGAFGCNGKTPQTAVALPADATDLATAEALANALKAALIANGICS